MDACVCNVFDLVVICITLVIFHVRKNILLGGLYGGGGGAAGGTYLSSDEGVPLEKKIPYLFLSHLTENKL